MNTHDEIVESRLGNIERDLGYLAGVVRTVIAWAIIAAVLAVSLAVPLVISRWIAWSRL